MKPKIKVMLVPNSVYHELRPGEPHFNQRLDDTQAQLIGDKLRESFVLPDDAEPIFMCRWIQFLSNKIAIWVSSDEWPEQEYDGVHFHPEFEAVAKKGLGERFGDRMEVEA